VKVVWGLLKERFIDQFVLDCAMDVAATCAEKDYLRLAIPYLRADDARNMAVETFLKATHEPDDVLVMLDADHLHPPYVVWGLARHQHDIGVVGALAFRRGSSTDPMFWFISDGKLRAPADWKAGELYQCDFVGTGAIAVKRWVFDQLLAEGEELPFFRLTYHAGWARAIGEDRYFADLCLKHGIRQHCDTAIEIPHLDYRLSTSQSWQEWKQQNMDKLRWSKFNPDAPLDQGATLPAIRTAVKG